MKLSAATSRNVRSADAVAPGRPASQLPAEGSAESEGRSLRRGLMVLDAVLQGGWNGVRVVDLCRQCALQRPTVYRLLATLMDCRYVVRQGRFRYAPGPRILSVAAPTSLT